MCLELPRSHKIDRDVCPITASKRGRPFDYRLVQIDLTIRLGALQDRYASIPNSRDSRPRCHIALSPSSGFEGDLGLAMG
jgi:hypothetical protein